MSFLPDYESGLWPPVLQPWSEGYNVRTCLYSSGEVLEVNGDCEPFNDPEFLDDPLIDWSDSIDVFEPAPGYAPSPLAYLSVFALLGGLALVATAGRR